MTFRKRLLVAFFTVIVVPMLLFAISFIALGNYLMGEKSELRGYRSIVGSYQDYDRQAVLLYREAIQNRNLLADVEYLDRLSSGIDHGGNVYLAVRRDGELYYASDGQRAQEDLEILPAWQEDVGEGVTSSAAALSMTGMTAYPVQNMDEETGENQSYALSEESGERQEDTLAEEAGESQEDTLAEEAGESQEDTLAEEAGESQENALAEEAGESRGHFGAEGSGKEPGRPGSRKSEAGPEAMSGSRFINSGSRSLAVRQVDFRFPDGAKGSLFIVSRMTGLISRQFLSGMIVSMLTILIFTAFLLTSWIEQSVFTPISAINIAMNNIRDGNLTYTLSTGEEGEIGELYRNYEDMRLRLKESADEKLERERQSRELISNISHDLKTPITSIKGYVEGLVDGVANTPEKQEKYLRTIYNKANDMDLLIDELTLYSRFESDRIPYNFHRLNVGEYFGDCVEEIGMDMESMGIELNFTNLVSPRIMIIADPEQMKRVVNNIVGNSVKYMDKEKGRIDIRILDEQDSVRVEIEDNGKGIAEKDIPHIFDRFFRTDSSRNSSRGGSGIGLSIVRKIIEDHGGYIWATSREGEGTCMHFVIRKYLDRSGGDGDICEEEPQTADGATGPY